MSIMMPVPAAVNHFVFCLHAFNIPHYRDKYNPPGLKTVILITAAFDIRISDLKFLKSSTSLRAKSQELRANLNRTKI